MNASEKIGELKPRTVVGGKTDTLSINADPNMSFIVKKGNQDKIKVELHIPDKIKAPIGKNQIIGTASLNIDSDKVAECNIMASESIERVTLGSMFGKVIKTWLCMNND